MKVLFVCKANVGRSQVAQVAFSQISKHESLCAGFKADGGKVKDFTPNRAVGFIKDKFGVDISERPRVPLIQELLDAVDLIIVINAQHDITGGPKRVQLWDIPDTIGLDDEAAHRIWEGIIERVNKLVAEIG